MKKLRITVEGKTYEVVVESIDSNTAPTASRAPVRAAVAAAAVAPVSAPPAKPAGGSAMSIRSQLAGRIVSVDIAVGAEVGAGQQLLVLEAMKMNTPVVAPRAGTVTAIHVTAGENVEEGHALVDVQ
ncbi:MAG: acetyl-CoA carboxylase biotin carboxyl carrier protein subunit [Fibrobacteria bacterium]|nr:acetyl-CoA carboxylase biotin carboxyl carrier protein subunit [Fibrobacteria bacterium]